MLTVRAGWVGAIAICEQCPVIKECAEHALRVREPYGVWGGMTEDDREAYYAQQARPASA